MFAQFRSQYPQGSIITEMLPKSDGLHVFRASIRHGDTILSTATAADTDIEVAEDRAIKRALVIAGISFDGNYGMKAVLMPQPLSNNALSNNALSNNALSNNALVNSLPKVNTESLPPSTRSPEQLDLTNFNPDYRSSYASSDRASPEPNYARDLEEAEPDKPPVKSNAAVSEFATEPVDLSDQLARILVEMDRIGWTPAQGRDYLMRTYKKKSRQELSPAQISEFLSYLQTQPTLQI